MSTLGKICRYLQAQWAPGLRTEQPPSSSSSRAPGSLANTERPQGFHSCSETGRTAQQRHCSRNRNADYKHNVWLPKSSSSSSTATSAVSAADSHGIAMFMPSKSSFATVTPTEPHFYPSVCAALCKVTAFIRIRQRSINSSVGILSLSFHTNTARPTSATIGMKLHSGLVATQKTLETAVWDSKYKKYLFDAL